MDLDKCQHRTANIMIPNSYSSSHTFQRLVLIFTLTVAAGNICLSHTSANTPLLSNSSNRDKITVTTEEQCRQYLCKYGYLDCNCLNVIEDEGVTRRKREIFNFYSILPTEYSEDISNKPVTLPTSLATPRAQACTVELFAKGYIEFQKVYDLVQTGECDNDTKQYMSKRRCGQPDIFDMDAIKRKSSEGFGEAEVRYKRSLYSLISHQTKREATIERRKEILNEYIRQQDGGVHETYGGGGSTRKRRSILSVQVNDYRGYMTKQRISWRLMSSHISNSIPVNTQNAVLMHAFRYWSEVSPLCFEEKKQAPVVDIEIGFVEGVHLNCFKRFDGYGGEIAHKFIRDVHFDKTEPYSSEASSENTINLLLVAVHEIGHVLGFNHSTAPGSVMHAIYHRNIKGNFELSDYDRAEVKKAYGGCSGRFDLAFDFVRTVGSSRRFNTYFFRGDNYWLYENKNRRARFGDPLKIDSSWRSLPSDLDAYLHFFDQDTDGLKDEYYFFKGDRYYQYSESRGVFGRGTIRSKFRRGVHGEVPTNLDSVFYEFLTKQIFFFKGEKVWKYSYKLSGNHSCCEEEPKRIRDLFPPKDPSDLFSPTGETYTRDIDVVYFSWTPPLSLYLIKGNYAWLVEGYSVFGSFKEANLRAKYVGPWNEIWTYICDVECPA